MQIFFNKYLLIQCHKILSSVMFSRRSARKKIVKKNVEWLTNMASHSGLLARWTRSQRPAALNGEQIQKSLHPSQLHLLPLSRPREAPTQRSGMTPHGCSRRAHPAQGRLSLDPDLSSIVVHLHSYSDVRLLAWYQTVQLELLCFINIARTL